MGGDTLNAGSFGIGLDQLPDHLLRQDRAAHSVGTIHRPEYEAVIDSGCGCPGVNRHFHPGHWNRSDSTVLACEVHDAPSPVALLNVCERERRYFGAAETAADEDRQDGPVAQALRRGGIGRAQECLSTF